MANIWWLYVDESGRFDRPSEGVVVGGILARDGSSATQSKRLEGELRRLAPEQPWPLHAHCYGMPLAHGLAAAAAPASDRAGARQAKTAELGSQIRKVLHERQGLLTRIERSLRAGEEPSRVGDEPDLKALDLELRQRAPALWAELEDLADQLFAYVSRVLERVCEAQQAHVVIASETEMGDGAKAGADRYLTVLFALAERAAAIVGRTPGRHVIKLMPLQRDVPSTRLPGVRTPMHAVEMTPRLRDVVCPPGVSLEFDSSPRWSPQMASALVLADFVANRARKTVPKEASLTSVEQKTAALIRVLPRVEGRSHLAASGLAREALHTPAAQLAARAGAPGVRRWAMDQAKEWRS
jgi:hypothetical protein